MYYPIIDKLKDVMAEISQGGGGGQLVIEATATSETQGTWTGSFSDIESAFANNTPVYCVISSGGRKIMSTLVCFLNAGSNAVCTPIFNGFSTIKVLLYSDNTVAISVT